MNLFHRSICHVKILNGPFQPIPCFPKWAWKTVKGNTRILFLEYLQLMCVEANQDKVKQINVPHYKMKRPPVRSRCPILFYVNDGQPGKTSGAPSSVMFKRTSKTIYEVVLGCSGMQWLTFYLLELYHHLVRDGWENIERGSLLQSA